jgi:hypothetical protein
LPPAPDVGLVHRLRGTHSPPYWRTATAAGLVAVGLLTATAVAHSTNPKCASKPSHKGCPAHSTTSGTSATTTTTTTAATTTTTTAATTTTTTAATTTTATTTTTGTTTPAPATSTYGGAISYTQSPPAFTPTRTIDVSSAADLRSAIANLQPGDLVKATSGFTVSGETIVGNRLASPAVLDLHGVSFVYSGGQNVPALYLANPENVRIYGGDFTTSSTGGYCINMHGGQHVLFWGFYAHDCGASGILITPVGAPVSNDDFQGQIARAGQNLAWDPCAEKGACFHGANLWDSGSAYAFTDNRFAFYIHDQASGAGVEVGNSVSAPAGGNVLYEKAVNLTFVSIRQTGGNGLQLHGVSGLGLDVKYLEVDNAEGRALDSNGIYDKVLGLLGVTTEYGRSSNTNENAALNEPSNTLPWDWRGGVLYQDVLPTP